jgi:hypothetical protein
MSSLASRLRALSRPLATALLGFTLLAATPTLAPAQTSGDNGPVVGKVAPGQQAGQVEGTIESVITYAANVIMPLIGGAFLILMIFLLKTQRGGWIVSLVCCIGCFVISGLLRLIEWHIQQGAGGVH